MDAYVLLTEKLKTVILKQYPSIRAFAKACGVPHGTVVSALTKGLGGTSFSNVYKMCSCLDVNIDELFLILEADDKNGEFQNRICTYANGVNSINNTFRGIYCNPSAEGFIEIINSECFVDKTNIIKYTNKYISTTNKYICVSRPRRFGKTVAANILAAYYSKGVDAYNLFNGYKISEDREFAKHLNKYNVVKLNILNFYTREHQLDRMLKNISESIMHDLLNQYSGMISNDDYIDEALSKIYISTGEKFVFIIDEWDCLLRMQRESLLDTKDYFDYLRFLLKDREYVALAYMTGILPIKKYGEHSALNMFREYSMTDASEFGEYVGFTENEVRSLCDKYDMTYDDMKSWYDGYYIGDVGYIYNPKSVVEAISRRQYDNYWTQTESYEALKVYIEMNFDGLKDDIIKMIAGDRIRISTRKFQNDMTSLNSKDDVMTLLVHLGYLAYNRTDSEVYIPNYEIFDEYVNAVEGAGWNDIVNSIKRSFDLLEATWKLDEVAVAKAIDLAHNEFASILKYNDENSLRCVLALAYYSSINYYIKTYEFPSGKGFADIVFLPKTNVDKPAMIVELKCNDSVESALEQIKERKYAMAFEDYEKNMLLVGISYNKKTKKHSCRIERFDGTKQ